MFAKGFLRGARPIRTPPTLAQLHEFDEEPRHVVAPEPEERKCPGCGGDGVLASSGQGRWGHEHALGGWHGIKRVCPACGGLGTMIDL